MNVIEIIQNANSIADEEVATDKAIHFVNDAIARINVKCDSKFPFFSLNEVSKEYEGFSETWQRALLVPFTLGRIKQTDSSQFEYSDAYGEFQDNLIEFKSKYKIPDKYKTVETQTSFEPDFSGNYYTWNGTTTNPTLFPPTAPNEGVDGGEF